MFKLVFSRADEMTASTYNQLYHNYTNLHTAQTATFPCSAVFYSLPPSTCSRPSNSMSFQTQSYFPDVWMYQQAHGHYLNWIHPKYTICEDQSSLIKHKICETNKKRPSVIQSTGQVLPLDEAGTNIPLTNVLPLPSKSLDVNDIISKGTDNKTAMLKKKQLSCERLVHKVYENQNISDPQKVSSKTRATKISVLDAPEEKGYKFCCRFCNKPYHWRSHWKAHERIHTGERPFKCEICGKDFTRSDGLQCHRHTHLRKKDSTNLMIKNEEYVPKGESFNDGNDKPKSEGKEHFKNRLHNTVKFSKSKKDFHCHLCRKSFYSSNGLQHHLRQHSKVKGVAGNVHDRC